QLLHPHSLHSFPTRRSSDLFIIGGAQVYAQLLHRCTDLYLTVVPRIVEGDAFLPEFEHLFDFADIALKTADFEVRHYRRNAKPRSEEHTSELQSLAYLVCRL